MPGPAPKPSAVKKLTGTYKASRAPKQEAAPTSELPPPPDFLPAAALAEWRRIVPELERIGLAKGVDYWLLVSYCETWARYSDVTRAITDMGEDRYQSSPRSGWKTQRPELTEQQQLVDRLCKLSAKIGLSPSDRTRVEAAPPKDADAEEFGALRSM